jgi:hypothetical protein
MAEENVTILFSHTFNSDINAEDKRVTTLLFSAFICDDIII